MNKESEYGPQSSALTQEFKPTQPFTSLGKESQVSPPLKYSNQRQNQGGYGEPPAAFTGSYENAATKATMNINYDHMPTSELNGGTVGADSNSHIDSRHYRNQGHGMPINIPANNCKFEMTHTIFSGDVKWF